MIAQLSHYGFVVVTVDISLFPIPDQVTFPLGVVPLHVFEPRYRQMVSESTEQKRRIGVAHIKSTISEGSSPDDLAEALTTNQSTYEPEDIFSAGFCKIKETMEDGRMIVEVEMENRYKIVNFKQQLPYIIVQCETYNDEESSMEQKAKSQLYRARLDQFMIANSGEGDHSFAKIIKSEAWQGLEDEAYSFSLFNVLQFDPDIQQEILEMKRPDQRLEFSCRVLNLI